MSGGRDGGRRRGDGLDRARRAVAADRDDTVYERARARKRRERAQRDRRSFDPRPVDDDDWTVEQEDTDGLRRMSAPTPIGSSLEAIVRRRGWDERLRAATAWSRWSEIVGPELAGRCEPVRLAGGTLVVRAASQVWATQLGYLLPQLRISAEQVLGPGTVQRIRVVVGPLEGPGGSVESSSDD